MLNLRPAYDIGDLVRKLDRVDAELLQSILTPASEGVSVLPASDDPEAAEALDAAAAATILEQLRANFTFAVVDCEHHMSGRTLAALNAAARIVLVTQLNVQALRAAQRSLALFRRLGYADDKIVVVVNRHRSSNVVSAADAAGLLGRSIFFRLPNDYKTATAAATKGVSIEAHRMRGRRSRRGLRNSPRASTVPPPPEGSISLMAGLAAPWGDSSALGENHDAFAARTADGASRHPSHIRF